MENVEVETTVGKFKIRKPNAGERNRALIKAEGEDGKLKQFIFLTELLPSCIVEHPFGAGKPLKQSLDGMSIDDYDTVTKAFGDILKSTVDSVNSDIKK